MRLAFGLGSAGIVVAACGGPSLDPFAASAASPAIEGGASNGSSTSGATGVSSQAGSQSTAEESPAMMAPPGGSPGSDGGSHATGGTGSAGQDAQGGLAAASDLAGAPAAAGNGPEGDSVVIPPQSACFAHTVVPPLLLADCEAGSKDWFAYADDHQAPVAVIHPGAGATQTAVRFAGGAAKNAGVGLGLFCADVSSFAGVSF